MVGELGKNAGAQELVSPKSTPRSTPRSISSYTPQPEKEFDRRIPIDWPAVGRDYVHSQLGVNQICRRYGISNSALAYARSRFDWPSRYRKRKIPRKHLISRLFTVLEKQIDKLEIEMKAGESSDKEVALLSTLSRTLEKLVELETKQSAPERSQKKSSPEMTILRKKIARRISQLEKI